GGDAYLVPGEVVLVEDGGRWDPAFCPVHDEVDGRIALRADKPRTVSMSVGERITREDAPDVGVDHDAVPVAKQLLVLRGGALPPRRVWTPGRRPPRPARRRSSPPTARNRGREILFPRNTCSPGYLLDEDRSSTCRRRKAGRTVDGRPRRPQ